MNGEFGEVFSRIPLFFFFHSPFSPFHLFFNFPKLLNSYFLSFPSRSALIRVYPRQKNPFLLSIFSFPQLSSSFLFQTAKLLQVINIWPLPGLNLYYFFDYGDSWVFEIKKISFKKYDEFKNSNEIKVIEKHGKNPIQYSCSEDTDF